MFASVHKQYQKERIAFVRQLYFTKIRICTRRIRQMCESQSGYYKKTRPAKFTEKGTFIAPWYAHVCVSIVFREIWRALFSCVTPVLRFALLPHCRQLAQLITWLKYFFATSLLNRNHLWMCSPCQSVQQLFLFL